MIINLARRAHNHNWELDPITRSLLDTDFYKLLMLQFIWKHFPQIKTSFSFSNRSTHVRLGEVIDVDELREQLEQTRQQKHQGELTSARLRQAAGDLETRLRERDAQIASLEEKHNHARFALEQQRQATKEQQEQEQRQHQAQLQQLTEELRQSQQHLAARQDELTRLNRDNERLLTEARLLRDQQQEQQQQLARHALAMEALRQERAQAEGARSVLEQRNLAQGEELARLEQHGREQSRQLQALQQRLQELSLALRDEAPGAP